MNKESATIAEDTEGILQGSEDARTELNNETVQFQEGGTVSVAAVKTARDATFSSTLEDPSTLANFLKRDTFLFLEEWSTTAEDFQIGIGVNKFLADIWALWQSDARIKEKLSNFTYFAGDFVITLRANGSPFQFGRLLCAYVPYMQNQAGGSWASTTNRNQMAALAMGLYESPVAIKGKSIVATRHFSTYPHGWIDPSQSNTVEIRCPFVWHKNAINICGDENNALESLGALVCYPISDLQIANSSAPTKLDVVCYGRMENVKLAIPTEYTPAASEYEMDESKKSSTNDAAKSLTSIPIIGKLAKASQLGVSAVGDIGKLFGFNKPSAVDSADTADLKLASNFANTSGHETAETLTLDPKQEIILGGDAIGVDPVDEMAFENINTKEQFVAIANWIGSKGHVSDSEVVFFALVSPNIPTITYGAQYTHNARHWQPSIDHPMGMMANMFGYWKGSITYRVEVVCTAMHSGRLLIQFDPWNTNAVPVQADVFVTDVNARYSQILDLKETNTCEFTIEYVNSRPWLQTLQTIESYHWPATPEDTITQLDNCIARHDQEVHMGMFSVSVLNEAVGPIAVTAGDPLKVMIFARGGDDLQFAMPQENWGLDDNGHKRWGRYIYVPRGLCWSRPMENDLEVNISSGDLECPSTCCGAVRRKRPRDEVEDAYYEYTDLHGHLEPKSGKMEMIIQGDECDDEDVFFGESVRSWRTLAKRYVGYSYYEPAATADQQGFERRIPHYNPTAHHDGTVGGKARIHSFESYCSPMYLTRRGGTRKRVISYNNHFADVNGNAQGLFVAEREALRATASMAGGTVNLDNSANLMTNMPHGFNGFTVRDYSYNPMLDVQMPFYSNTRFDLAAAPYNVDDDAPETLRFNPTMTHILSMKYVFMNPRAGKYSFMEMGSVADDYNAAFFTGAPVIWNWISDV